MRTLTLKLNDEVIYETQWGNEERVLIRRQIPSVERTISQTGDTRYTPTPLIGALNILRDCMLDNLDSIREANNNEDVGVDEVVLTTFGMLCPYLNEKHGATCIEFWRKTTDSHVLGGANVSGHSGKHIQSLVDMPVPVEAA